MIRFWLWVCVVQLCVHTSAAARDYYHCAIADDRRYAGERDGKAVSIFDTWAMVDEEAGEFRSPTGYRQGLLKHRGTRVRDGRLYHVLEDTASWLGPDMDWFIVWTFDIATSKMKKHHVVSTTPDEFRERFGRPLPFESPCAPDNDMCGQAFVLCTPNNNLCGRRPVFEILRYREREDRYVVAWEKSRWRCERAGGARFWVFWKRLKLHLGWDPAPERAR